MFSLDENDVDDNNNSYHQKKEGDDNQESTNIHIDKHGSNADSHQECEQQIPQFRPPANGEVSI